MDRVKMLKSSVHCWCLVGRTALVPFMMTQSNAPWRFLLTNESKLETVFSHHGPWCDQTWEERFVWKTNSSALFCCNDFLFMCLLCDSFTLLCVFENHHQATRCEQWDERFSTLHSKSERWGFFGFFLNTLLSRTSSPRICMVVCLFFCFF